MRGGGEGEAAVKALSELRGDSLEMEVPVARDDLRSQENSNMPLAHTHNKKIQG